MSGLDFFYTLPLLLISVVALLAMLVDAFGEDNKRMVAVFSAGGLGLVALSAVILFPVKKVVFNNMINTGGFASFFDVLFASAGILTILTGHSYLSKYNMEKGEFYTLTLFAVSGMMLIAHSNHLLITFIGIEVMSIPFYVMAAFIRNKALSVEAGLKYFLLGAFSTGFLLYGIALVFGSAGGTFHYDQIRAAVSNPEFPQLMLLGSGLIIIGLCFKIAAFPFHAWAPDVYQGAPTTVTGFMSTAGKAAAFSALIPLVVVLMPMNGTPESAKLRMVLTVISVASMLFGNIVALSQKNIKRMLAYSSVAHAGYMLIGIVAPVASNSGTQGILFYVASYLCMQLGAFVVLALLEKEYGEHLMVNDLRGLSKKHPVLAMLMSVFMLSLAGIPPFAGFFGKYYIFMAAIESGMIWIAVVGIVASLISVAFYLSPIIAMYFYSVEDGHEPVASELGLSGIVLLVVAMGVIVLGVAPSLLLGVIQRM
jgi:NADH-quinone oxidoreductase subunit N